LKRLFVGHKHMGSIGIIHKEGRPRAREEEKRTKQRSAVPWGREKKRGKNEKQKNKGLGQKKAFFALRGEC